MATIAVGDVHGNARALGDLLGRLPPAMSPEDTLVFLGDLIDRGPDSRLVLDEILCLRDEAPFEVVCLMGNHELWMLDTLADATKHHWVLSCQALPTIASYAPEVADDLRHLYGEYGIRLFEEPIALPYDRFFDRMPHEHRELIRSMPRLHRTADVICVHGGVRADGAPPCEEDGGLLVWGHPDFPDDYRGAARVVYGHHNDAVLDAEGWPSPRVLHDLTFGIDTISHGVLTAVRFPDLAVFQSERHL